MRRLVQTLLPLALLLAAGCGSGDSGGPTEPPLEPDLVVDPALVGAWVGRIGGSGGGISGAADIRFELDATGFMSVSVSNPPFHDMPTGSWGIVGDEFRASGTDNQGAMPYFVAPRSETRMQGTWRSGIASGTFDVTKE